MATFYKFAVIDGVIPANPAATVAGCSGCVKGKQPNGGMSAPATFQIWSD